MFMSSWLRREVSYAQKITHVAMFWRFKVYKSVTLFQIAVYTLVT